MQKTPDALLCQQSMDPHILSTKLLGRALRWLLVIIVDPGRAALRVPGTKVVHVAVGVVFDLVNGGSFDGRVGLRKEFLQLRQHLGSGVPCLVGELDVHSQVEVAASVAALDGHALAGDLEDLSGRQNLAGRVSDLNATSVEMLQHNAGESSQRLRQGDVDSCAQIGASPVEDLVFFLDQLEDNVAILTVWDLVRLPFQDDFISLTNKLSARCR